MGCRCGEELRRFSFVPSSATYDKLYKLLQTLFSKDEFILKYKDDEGDKVTLSNDAELELAIQLARAAPEERLRILRLYLLESQGSHSPEVARVIQEIQNQSENPIAPSVFSALDATLEDSPPQQPVIEEDSIVKCTNVDTTDMSHSPPVAVAVAVAAITDAPIIAGMSAHNSIR